MDRCDSRMNIANFIRLAMSAIGLQIGNTRASLKSLFSATLFQIQNREKENHSASELIDDIIDKSVEQLITLKAIKKPTENAKYTLTFMASAAMAGSFNIIFKQENFFTIIT